MEWVKRGVTFVIDLSVLAFLTWEEIEIRACGRKDIEIPDLKAITEYTYCSEDHKMIKFFWSMFVGTVCGTVANMDPHGALFKQRMDELNFFLREERVPQALCVRAREKEDQMPQGAVSIPRPPDKKS